jgi:hypothetical protein
MVHSLIDFLKCRHRYGLAMDQCLHLLCKVLWVVIATQVLGLRLI